MPRERLPFRPHDLLIAALCLVLSSAATGQAASFERLRAAFEKELASGDFEARKAAIEQLAELGHPDVARFLVDRVRGAFRDSENMRAAHAEAAVRQSDLKRELDRVSRLVGQGKLGRKATEDAERDHQKAVEETKRLAAKLKEEEKVHEVLRRAVGWVLERCTGGHQDAAIRIVMDAYRGTKDPGETVEILRMMAWIDHPKVREFLDERVRDKDATVRFAAVRAFDAHNKLIGRGYLELTGYDRPLRM